MADSQATLVSEPSTSAGGSSCATLAAGAGLQDGGEAGDEKQFVAAFRGRAVRGTKVELPEGFAGVVLSTLGEDEEGGAAEAEKKGGRRRTRGASRRWEDVEDVMCL